MPSATSSVPGLLRVEVDRELADPLVGVDPDRRSASRSSPPAAPPGRGRRGSGAVPPGRAARASPCRSSPGSGSSRRRGSRRVPTASIEPETAFSMPKTSRGSVPANEPNWLQLAGVGAREVLGVALDPRLAGGQLLREQREADVGDVAVLDRLELPVLGAAEVARDGAAEARAEALDQLGERREVDRHLRRAWRACRSRPRR